MSESSKNVWVEVDIEFVTDHAVLCRSGTSRKEWVPLSQIIDHTDEIENDASIEIEIPRWLAEKKEFV